MAPAGPLSRTRIEAAAERCRHLGLEPSVGRRAGGRAGFLAGSDPKRLADLQGAFDDPTSDAVWSLRGGYGTTRIVDQLDLSRQLRDPIPFIGFSDNTTLHARHLALGVVSFHGPHPVVDDPVETDVWFRRVLFSTEAPGPLPVRGVDPSPRTLVDGTAEGRLVGGNLALVASLCGTRDAVDGRGRILVLEDVGEPAYRVDRMLLQLRRAGTTDGIVGLALGRFTDTPEGEADGVAAVLDEFATALGVPAVADLPFGHAPHNCVLPLGALAVVGDGGLSILEAAVR